MRKLLFVTVMFLLVSELSLAKSPTIQLIGENHLNPECIQYKEKLIEDARNKSKILALEGLIFNKEDSEELLLFGIEDRDVRTHSYAIELYFALFLYNSAELLEQNSHSAIAGSHKESAYMYYFSASKTLDSIFLCLELLILEGDDAKIGSTPNPLLVKLSKLYLQKKKQPELYEDMLFIFEKQNSRETPFFMSIHESASDWLEFFKESLDLSCAMESMATGDIANIVRPTIAFTNAVESCLKLNLGLPGQFRTFLESSLKIQEVFPSLSLEVTLFGRDRVFLKNILEIFEITKSENKPFYVNVGYDHSPFLRKELTKLGFEVEFTQCPSEDVNL